MPINELSDARRVGRDFKVRLGIRKKGGAKVSHDTPVQGTYPSETDYFEIEQAPEDVRNLYGATPKSLRIMLYQEWDTKTAQGDELVWSLNNLAYGLSKGLRCKGHGRSAESPDFAVTSDAAWMSRIEEATKYAPESLPSLSGTPRWRVRCLGRDCPKYLLMTEQPDPSDPAKTKSQLAPDHDRDASCKAVGILRCFLLHPATDPQAPDYCKPLGVMELATGSYNSIVDLQSDFDMKLRAFTGGRTAGVPVTLIRKATKTYRGVPAVHWTCALSMDAHEVQRWAAVPLNEVFLSESYRATLKRLAAEPLGMTIDSVVGLLPEHLVPEDLLAQPGGLEDGAGNESGEATAGLLDRPGSSAGPQDPSPFLVKGQRDELKVLAGGLMDPTQTHDPLTNPWRPEALERLQAAIVAMNTEAELVVVSPPYFSNLRLVHVEWLKKRLAELPPLVTA